MDYFYQLLETTRVVDKNGKCKSEDPNQIFRRIPYYIWIEQNQFTIGINPAFSDNDALEKYGWEHYDTITQQGNLSKIYRDKELTNDDKKEIIKQLFSPLLASIRANKKTIEDKKNKNKNKKVNIDEVISRIKEVYPELNVVDNVIDFKQLAINADTNTVENSSTV